MTISHSVATSDAAAPRLTLATSLRRVLVLALLALTAPFASAQQFSKEQLDQLTAQIALYPDALLSQMLMASTYPSDVAEAAQWARAHPDAKGDEAVKQVQDREWDPSVTSLVAFPQVIITMGEKPDWVKDLGDAFLAQPEDVMDSVQRLRAQAQKAGNLQSTEQAIVRVESAPPDEGTTRVVERQVIYIEPAQPQFVYVPTYNPTVVYGPWMYPALPPVYVPPPPGYWWSVTVGGAIATGIAWGVSYAVRDALWGGCNWWRRDVNININHYNNININRRINVNTTQTRWAHDTKRRGAVPYRGGDATKQKLTRKAESVKRDNYRGRAEATMRDKGIQVDRAAAREQNRDRTPIAARDRGGDRPQPSARDVAGKQPQPAGRDQTRDRPAPVTRDQARDKVATRDREQAKAQAKNMNRDFALKEAGNRQARPQIDRGTQSRQSMRQQRPQVQRPAPRPQARPQAQPRPQARPQPRPQARPQARPQVQRSAR